MLLLSYSLYLLCSRRKITKIIWDKSDFKRTIYEKICFHGYYRVIAGHYGINTKVSGRYTLSVATYRAGKARWRHSGETNWLQTYRKPRVMHLIHVKEPHFLHFKAWDNGFKHTEALLLCQSFCSVNCLIPHADFSVCFILPRLYREGKRRNRVTLLTLLPHLGSVGAPCFSVYLPIDERGEGRGER